MKAQKFKYRYLVCEEITETESFNSNFDLYDISVSHLQSNQISAKEVIETLENLEFTESEINDSLEGKYIRVNDFSITYNNEYVLIKCPSVWQYIEEKILIRYAKEYLNNKNSPLFKDKSFKAWALSQQF